MTPLLTEDDIQGWYDEDMRRLYQQMVDEAPDRRKMNCRHLVEVGSWKGKSIVALGRMVLAADKRAVLYAVDTGLGIASEKYQVDEVAAVGGSMMKTLRNNLSLAGTDGFTQVISESSIDAAKKFPNGCLDFVFLDADHSYDCVLADLRAWWPRVRPGGVLAGHDLLTEPGVRHALKTWEREVGLKHEARGNCWVVRKAGTVLGLRCTEQ